MVMLNGHDLNVETHGSREGPAVVLLHHGLGSLAAWRAQIPALVKAGYRALAYDRWGYGESMPRTDRFIPDFASDQEDLLAVLDHNQIERAALVGHSDGGTLALHFAARWPQRVVCLVLVAAHIYVEPKMKAGIEAVRAAFDGDNRFRRALERVHGEKTSQVFANWFDGWVQSENLGWDLRPMLIRIACPALVVQGSLDEHATPRHAEDLADALPNSELWLLPAANHMLPQEHAAEFNSRLMSFLDRYLPIPEPQTTRSDGYEQ